MIRILVVDDQRVIRQGLRALLEPEPDFQVVGDADNGQNALEQVAALQPDVVLLDLWMPVMDGIAATRVIREQFEQTKVLILSGSDAEDSLAQALQAGAMGYLLKDTPADEIAQAIRSVHRGYVQVGPGLFEKILARVPSASPQPVQSAASDRAESGLPEMEVLRLLKSFDPAALEQVVQLAAERQMITSLFQQISHYLERRPRNVAALYLAGALANRHPTSTAGGLPYLQQGLQEGLQQGLPFADLVLFYQEGVRSDPNGVLPWLAPRTGLSLDQPAWSALLQEAAEIVGPNSGHYQTLVLLRQVQTAAAWSDLCLSLRPKLEGLQRGLQQLTGVLSV